MISVSNHIFHMEMDFLGCQQTFYHLCYLTHCCDGKRLTTVNSKSVRGGFLLKKRKFPPRVISFIIYSLFFQGSRFSMTHKNILETTKQIESMDQIRAKANGVRFQSSSTSAFAFGEEYIRWQTNRVNL